VSPDPDVSDRHVRAGITVPLGRYQAGINHVDRRRPGPHIGYMQIGLLGPVTAGTDVALPPRDRVVLSALVVRHGSVVTAEELADALWGDRPPASWRKVVPGCVNRLRKALGADAISTSAHGYRLDLADGDVDVVRFERLVTKGHQMLALGEPDRAALAFREALALWRGPALRDVEDWPPARAEIERLEELRLETEEGVIDASLRVGLQAGVLAEARSRVSQAPVRERRWALLALAQYLSGSQADALDTLQRARTMLSRELGLDPGHELVELEQAMLRQEASLTVATALPHPVAHCPYPGLLPYEVGDADFFFGRATDVASCRRRLADTGVLVLVGPSGSGKSSLLRAGLAASLAEEGTPTTIVPTGVTEDELLAEVHNGEGRSVLVVDQVEEVMARLGGADQRVRLAEALVSCTGRRRLALAVRADRLGDLADLPGFAGLVESGLGRLGPLGEEALRAAIEGPAQAGALLLEPGLVDVLLRDVRDDPGALPLLSHALRETWERRDGRTLTVEGYRASGGIRGAVARSAEQVYDTLPDEDRAKLRGLMLRLLTLAPDGEPLRSAIPRDAIPGDSAHAALVERLVRARLVTADADVLDLAHETLARAWPRLRGWLDDDLEGQRTLRHLSASAESWHAMGRPDAELYRGERLVRALAWQVTSGADLTAHEAAFLTQSRQLAEAATAEVEQATATRLRNRRRAGVLVTVAVALAVVAGMAAWVAVRERDRAAEDRAGAAAEREVASARRAASRSLATDDAASSLLLAVEAVRRDDSPDTRATLLDALQRRPALVRVIPLGGRLEASPDGDSLYVLGDGLRRVDAASLVPVAGNVPFSSLLAEDGRIVFPEGREVHAETPSGRVRMLPVPGGVQGDLWLTDEDMSARHVVAVADRESPGARRYQSTVVAWEPRHPKDAFRLRVTGTAAHGGVDDVVLDPSGRRVYVASRVSQDRLRVYDTDTDTLIARLPASEVTRADRIPAFVSASLDGRTLATNDGADLALVDCRTAEVTSRLRGHIHPVVEAEFSFDSRLVAAGALDGSVIVWDRASGTLLERLEGNGLPVESLAFSPNSATLYGSTESEVLAWDLAGARRLVSTRSQAVGDLGYLAVAGPDGHSAAFFRETVATFGRDQSFDVVTDQGRHVPVPAGFANWGVYAPSGDELATVVDDRIQVWDGMDGGLLREGQVPGVAHAEAATWTADGAWIVVADRDGTVRAVDAQALTPVGVPVDLELTLADVVPAGDAREVAVLPAPGNPDGSPLVVQVDPTTGGVDTGGPSGTGTAYAAVSPDGTRLAVTLIDGGAGLVDLDRGTWLAGPTRGHTSIASRVDFNGDGSRFVTSGFDGRVVLWDGRTGAQLASMQPVGPEFATGVTFLRDGHTVAIAASNGQLFRWDTDPQAWVEHACEVAGRNLGPEEWAAVFGSEPLRATCPQWPVGTPRG
jgi:DNA-binding SARP family transcriptional activator/WD40 repeat protein/energy-coupling factor transporter ATP-binding protein EcfA2